MKPISSWRLLPHEIFFGLFLVITWARLVAAAGVFSGSSVLYAALIAANFWVVWLCRAKDRPLCWRVASVFYFIAMNITYEQMKVAVPLIHPAHVDGALRALDTTLIGTNLSLRLQAITTPALTELFSLSYMFFYPYLTISFILYVIAEVELQKKFMAGFFTIYGVGFMGYTLAPASGPYKALAGEFTVPLHGWVLTQCNATIVARGCNGADVFPSLHCAISAFILCFDRRHRPLRFWICLVPCVGLWVSTIYLRYHYFIDCICGFALAAFALWLAERFPKKQAGQSKSGSRLRS